MLESRLSKIMEKLEKSGNIEVKHLSQELGVTEKTIRHDLTKMEKMGLLKRVHGGAVPIIKQAEDAYANTARKISLHNKEQIARTAFEYVRQLADDRPIFYVDASTTNYEFVRYLKNLPITVITNDLLIASLLSVTNVTLHLTGGRILNNVNKYLIGPDAIDTINKHYADICFIGTSSISTKDGCMTYNNEDIAIKRAMLAHSKFSICLADHTKFENTSFVKFADISEINMIITDQATEEQVKAFEDFGVKILTASEDL